MHNEIRVQNTCDELRLCFILRKYQHNIQYIIIIN